MIDKIKSEWKDCVSKALEKYIGSDDFPEPGMGVPPKPEMGDIAFPMFAYAKIKGMNPVKIANEVCELISSSAHPAGTLSTAGAYLNVKIDSSSLFSGLAKTIIGQGDSYGKNSSLEGKKVMLEFSCPNTNKPLHLGHMRNDSLGESVAAILKANGADVMKVNLINNRGVHICKSMLAYKEFANGETPERTGEKGDHFVGRYYVRFANWSKEVEARIKELEEKGCKQEAEKLKADSPDARAQRMLKAWEDGDEEVLALWRMMNKWTLDGLEQSYKDMGISFDRYYYESDTYKFGKSEVLKGLEQGVFFREKDGSVQIDLADIGLDKKVLLRKDGTTIYITQDLGTAIRRHEDWPFDSMIYVVASEQAYHFKVLFHILKKLGYGWAAGLHHLSYGMVNLPEGKMKSREGTVVDADDLLAELSSLAKDEIISKGREALVGDVEECSRKIALAALNYYLLQVSPSRDMIFDPKKSISFSGNTGPYLEYMGARISSILKKASEEGLSISPDVDGSLLCNEDEEHLILLLSSYPALVKQAAEGYDPSVITSFLYDVAKTFSHYYHDNQILKADTPALISARLCLCQAVLQVLKNGFALVGIPFLESM